MSGECIYCKNYSKPAGEAFGYCGKFNCQVYCAANNVCNEFEHYEDKERTSDESLKIKTKL